VTHPAAALTVDLEEWNDGCELPPSRVQVIEDTHWLLDTFAATGARATFFVLGNLGRRLPNLIREIHEAGHEIACHGATHQWLHRWEPGAFRRELSATLDFLCATVGAPVRGFRAPFFSLTRRSSWAIGVLDDLGFDYDASIYPGRNDRYGWQGAPLQPARVAGTGLIEFPVPLHRYLKVAFSGGAYLRILPWRVVDMEFRRRCEVGAPNMVYVHPWEISDHLPWAGGAALRGNLTRHLGRARMRGRLTRLLSSPGVHFATMAAVLDALPDLPVWDPDDDKARGGG
jgi:polysaccharide deacetylase family protein (PEP-CTERM system associated)